MTYFSFLFIFLVLPITALSGLTLWDIRHRREWFARYGRWAAGALLVHVGLAVTYTTPWDNYLVATRVWWYDPARVLGLTLGWVPLEEYLFFVLQPFLTGLLLFALLRRTPLGALTPSYVLRFTSALLLALLWLTSAVILGVGWQPGTYLGLELIWALPPIILQLAVGADILWHYRRVVVPVLFGVTTYLCAADFLAIDIGVWTIDPAQSLNIFIGGTLPIEEVFFFLLTNTLLVFGLTLALAPETWARWTVFRAKLQTSEVFKTSEV